MGISILLRTNISVSHFRRNLLRLIKAPNSKELLLCSGYIYEYPKYYSILNDDLLKAIVSGCSNMIAVAGMLKHKFWDSNYRRFLTNIRNSKVNLTAYRAISNNWHAKVAIKLHNGTPIAGLVGSSNLTGPAYRENSGNFNYEADVLIWKDSPAYNKYFREETTKFESDPLGPIDTILNPELKKQIIEEDRLKSIYDLILKQQELEIYEF